MKTLKLFSLTLALSLAGLVYASGGAAQGQSQTKESARVSCCVAGAECCKAGADCCKSGGDDWCAGGMCNMKEHAARHSAAPAAGQTAAAHGGHHKADAQAGAAHSCPADGAGCCAAHKAEGQTAEGGCCRMHGATAAAHAAHAPGAGHAAHAAGASHAAHAAGAAPHAHGATAGGEKAHASCCMMHKSGGPAEAKAGVGCCAGGAECCKAGAACCAATAAKAVKTDNKQ